MGSNTLDVDCWDFSVFSFGSHKEWYQPMKWKTLDQSVGLFEATTRSVHAKLEILLRVVKFILANGEEENVQKSIVCFNIMQNHLSNEVLNVNL